jgi:hypothetical protein
MLLHLPIVIMTALHPTPVADTTPNFDIARECRSEGGSQDMLKRCADDETQAREQLQKEWAQFTPANKVQCNEETNVDGSASYVEMLTCLEMEKEVRSEQQATTKTPK